MVCMHAEQRAVCSWMLGLSLGLKTKVFGLGLVFSGLGLLWPCAVWPCSSVVVDEERVKPDQWL